MPNIKVVKWNEIQKGMRTWQPEGDAPHAWPRGTRVRKVMAEDGDGHRDGKKGTIYSSLGPVPEGEFKGLYAYWVSWDDHPGVPCGIRSDRLALDNEGDC